MTGQKLVILTNPLGDGALEIRQHCPYIAGDVQSLSHELHSSRLDMDLKPDLVLFAKHQSFKASYSDGAYFLFGSNYHNVQAGRQLSWIGWPRREK